MKKHYIQAGALTYAIFIMLVTLIVIGSLITIAFHHRVYVQSELARKNLISYNQSVLTAALCDSTLSFPWDAKELSLTENTNYTFNVTKEPWGGYFVYTATSVYKKYQYEQKVLCGANGVLSDDMALYMADNNNAISISGNTALVGNCQLPKAGIKASYMEGNYYRGKELVYGDISNSSSSIPPVDSKYLSNINELLNGKLKSTDSIINFSDLTSNEYCNSFYQKTLYMVSAEPLFLNQCKFEGNIAIISSQPVTIFSSAELTDVMVFAPQIIIKKLATCNLQAYASDTILLERDVHLTFPSTIGVANKKNAGLITLNHNARIDGNIWMTKSSSEKENSNSCYFHKESFLQGIAHIEGKVSMQGDVYGSLYAEKFFLKTVSSYYENYLYNVEINAYALVPYYASAALNNKRGCKVIKVLEP